MSYYYNNPYGRRRAMSGPQPSGPTVADYQAVAKAYQDLQAQVQRQNQELAAKQRELTEKDRELAEKERELAIKDEALQRQGMDLKQVEAELVWAKAALQQQERAAQAEDGEGISWHERYMRLQAELDQLRGRWEQRFSLETTEARHTILRDMLPLADHLEMALRHAEGVEDEAARNLLRSIEVTHQAFLDTLRRYGVEPIAAQGQPFDPNMHEAVGQIQSDAVPAGAVVEVVQTGYTEGEKLLRPARVLVNV